MKKLTLFALIALVASFLLGGCQLLVGNWVRDMLEKTPVSDTIPLHEGARLGDYSVLRSVSEYESTTGSGSSATTKTSVHEVVVTNRVVGEREGRLVVTRIVESWSDGLKSYLVPVDGYEFEVTADGKVANAWLLEPDKRVPLTVEPAEEERDVRMDEAVVLVEIFDGKLLSCRAEFRERQVEERTSSGTYRSVVTDIFFYDTTGTIPFLVVGSIQGLEMGLDAAKARFASGTLSLRKGAKPEGCANYAFLAAYGNDPEYGAK